MNITILRLNQSVYIKGRGALEAFYANEGADIKVTEKGHFTVRAWGEQYMFPTTSVAWCKYEESSKEPVQKK